ncbi:hypothetical protein NPIL_657441 [Nephila pilipes]|uniref:Uncharacterized protein n=1 Tax=Nephila pilipes TaxID=299642 RepID=A0A8X6QEX1_NEPPI|nr:hypothetical protein NPIL_657441 [Nephila pilipes]
MDGDSKRKQQRYPELGSEAFMGSHGGKLPSKVAMESGHAATTLQLLAARLRLLPRGKEAERFPSLSVSSEMTNHRDY